VTLGGEASDVTFSAQRLYTADGIIVDSDGDPIPGVNVSFSDGAAPVVTDSHGTWESGELTGTVTVTPEAPAYEFTPADAEVKHDDASL